MTNSLWPQIIIASSTLIAAFLGYALAGLNEARRDRRAAEREKLARAEDRFAAAVRDRHQFQLETLLALQDAVQLMARFTGRAMHFDHMQAREGKYTQLPADHDAEIMSNRFDVIRLRNRLLDRDLRRAIERFESAASAGMMPPTHFKDRSGQALESDAAQLTGQFGDEYTLVMSQLGEALRTELSWLPADGR